MATTAPPSANAPILVADKDPDNVRTLVRFLSRWGHENVVSTTDSTRIVPLLDEWHPDLLLLDLDMTHPDGFEVMRQISERSAERAPIPILVLTTDASAAIKERALTSGASDFLTRPFDRTEVRLRVHNLLRTRRLQIALERDNGLLEQRVRDRTSDLDHARRETLERLALAAEYRDDETREHAQRVGRTASLLAAELGLAQEDVELLRRSAPLHDIGKLGVPDAILLKPGRLSREESEVMKAHTLIGSRILSSSLSAVLQAGEVIARTHHEQWDGNGYPAGLAGDAIPLSGRLVAVADTFDALTHTRPYRHAWPCERSAAELRGAAGSQLDPEIVQAFGRLDQTLLLSPIQDLDLAVA